MVSVGRKMGFLRHFLKDDDLIDRPQRMVDFSFVPLEGELTKIQRGYHFCQPTNNEQNCPDNGFHVGTDFSLLGRDLDMGAPVYNILNGLCVYRGSVGMNLGKIAILKHRMPDQTFLYSRYCHLQDWLPSLVVGKEYLAGEVIAFMGKSGWQRGFAHLHPDVAKQKTFEEKYSLGTINGGVDWYPHMTSPKYIQEYFVDPVLLIQNYLDPSNLPVYPDWQKKKCQQGVCRFSLEPRFAHEMELEERKKDERKN